MRWVSTFCHCRRVLDVLNTHSKEPKWETTLSNPKVVHGKIGPIPTKGKDTKKVAKARAKEGKESFPNFFLGVTIQTWTCMDVDFASTIRSISAQRRLMAQSVQKDGTFVAARAVLPPMLRKTTTKRSDARAASAHWLVLLGISQIA